MKAFSSKRQLGYDRLDRGMKKKGSGRKSLKTTKTIQKRRFRAILKNNLEKD